jgi:hypothetical protein
LLHTAGTNTQEKRPFKLHIYPAEDKERYVPYGKNKAPLKWKRFVTK